MCKKKIIATLYGGIGNQLFIYAAAKRLAMINQAELIIDNYNGFINDFEYQRKYQLKHFNMEIKLASKVERLEPFRRIKRYLMIKLNKSKKFEKKIL